MKIISRSLLLAAPVALTSLALQPALAAPMPAGIGQDVGKSTSLTKDVRYRGGYRGGGYRGGYYRGGWGRGGWGRRWGWGVAAGVGAGLALGAASAYGNGYYAAPAYNGYYAPSCGLTRGWVWNGYNYVWATYRTC